MSKAKGVPCPGRRKNPPQIIDTSKIPPEALKGIVADLLHRRGYRDFLKSR